ncbi:hypothetical protein AB9K26_02415 [Psychroserpens sp. XS_ASV72]|uniref:hypothetical protein n=1 Tax=Psychroserpens sp. XS_ASV72 TaxID=3241293 RepID=UPI0035157400
MAVTTKNEWRDLLQSLVQSGHRWRCKEHFFLTLTSYHLSDDFKSLRRWLVYIMHHANWLNLKETPYITLSDQMLADFTDQHMPSTYDKESMYELFGTNRNTFKKNYAKYLQIKQPTIGQVMLAMFNQWRDTNQELSEPIKKKDISRLQGFYPKKTARMFVEVPQVQDYLETIGLSYEKAREFPPRLIEIVFEEIGEPERYKELVAILNQDEEA